MSDHIFSPSSPPVPVPQQIPDTAVDGDVHIKEEEPITLPSPTASVAQTEENSKAPSSSPAGSIRKTEGQRRALLRNDPQAEDVEPQRVLCRLCGKWIRLSPNWNYVVANWKAHKQRCPSPSVPAPLRRTPSKPSISPGSRIATTERRIVLLNDPQVKTCSAEHVQCGNCMSTVVLGDKVEYDLTKWMEHKSQCIPMTPAPITPQGSTSHRARVVPPPSTSSTHSQVSSHGAGSQSTEITAVAESSPSAVTAVRTKRAREETSEDEGEEEHTRNRARTETYEPPEKSLFGWFMQPLKEFARGFREGSRST